MRIHAKAPVRVDFAGGWSDVPDFAEREGGRVVNAAITLYTHVSCQLGGGRIRLVAKDIDDQITMSDLTGLIYTGTLDLHKAALNMLPVSGGIEIVSHSEVPVGSGLGGSGSLDVSLLAALARAREEPNYDGEDLAEMGFVLEASELGLRGGRQDQYAAALGGVNDLHFGAGPPLVTPIDLDGESLSSLRGHSTLVYTGESHFSSDTHERVWDAFHRRRDGVTEAIAAMRDLAGEASAALRTADWEGLASAVDRNWMHQQRLDPSITTADIRRIEDAVRAAGAWGVKATGAGAGGCVFVLGPEDRRAEIEEAATAAGGRVLAWEFDPQGVRCWSEPPHDAS